MDAKNSTARPTELILDGVFFIASLNVMVALKDKTWRIFFYIFLTHFLDFFFRIERYPLSLYTYYVFVRFILLHYRAFL